MRDRASGEVLAQMECPTREPHAVLVTPDGREVLGVGATDGVLRWSRATGEPLAQVGLGKASRPEPSQAVVSRDGRHLALAPSAVFLVDLATGSARRLRRLPRIHSARGTLCLGFDASSARVRGATFSDYGQRVTFWSRAIAGGSAALKGESESARGRLLTPSSDGRLLWWAYEDGEDLAVCVTVAAASVAATAIARWPVGGWVRGCCAGRSLLAVAAGGDVVLFAERGRSLCTGLPDDCRPLAFTPDERALWVLDPVGLLLELTVPEALLDPPRG